MAKRVITTILNDINNIYINTNTGQTYLHIHDNEVNTPYEYDSTIYWDIDSEILRQLKHPTTIINSIKFKFYVYARSVTGSLVAAKTTHYIYLCTPSETDAYRANDSVLSPYVNSNNTWYESDVKTLFELWRADDVSWYSTRFGLHFEPYEVSSGEEFGFYIYGTDNASLYCKMEFDYTTADSELMFGTNF